MSVNLHKGTGFAKNNPVVGKVKILSLSLRYVFHNRHKIVYRMVFFGNVPVIFHFGGQYRKRLFWLLTVYTSINQRRIFVTFESIFLATNCS